MLEEHGIVKQTQSFQYKPISQPPFIYSITIASGGDPPSPNIPNNFEIPTTRAGTEPLCWRALGI
jgi:hypothetical protein